MFNTKCIPNAVLDNLDQFSIFLKTRAISLSLFLKEKLTGVQSHILGFGLMSNASPCQTNYNLPKIHTAVKNTHGDCSRAHLKPFG